MVIQDIWDQRGDYVLDGANFSAIDNGWGGVGDCEYDEVIEVDEDDCTPYDVYLDHEPTEFSDGAYRVHYDCLTEEEKKLMEKNHAR